METHWIALKVDGDNVTYFDGLVIEHIPKKIKTFIGKKMLQQIFLAYYSMMRGYFCIRFIDFMAKGKNLLEYTNSFSTNKYKKNDKTILKYF